MIEERPPVAAPHTPSDDPRVDILAENLVGYANWHRYDDEGRQAARFDAKGLLARLDAAAPAPESPREERDRLYREHVQACTDPRHKHPALDTPNDTPQFDWQAAEEGFAPCARGQRCELQLVRPGKVQCDCDTPGTEAAIARAEAEAAPARGDALARWLDTEIAEVDAVRGRARSMHLYDVAETRANALREVRDRLGATTNEESA